jgi:hypothetical protein
MAPSRLQLASDGGDREGEQCSMGETSCTGLGVGGLKKERWDGQQDVAVFQRAFK